MHFCLLVGYGAGGVNPYLVYETMAEMIDDGRISVRRYCSYVKMVHEVSRAGRQ